MPREHLLLCLLQVGAKVVSASFGGYAYSPAAKAAIEALGANGTTVVAAAGNESNDNDGPYPHYPSSYVTAYKNVISGELGSRVLTGSRV